MALPLFEETLKHMKAKLGTEHPETLRTIYNPWSQRIKLVGKLDLALPLQEEMLELTKAKFGPEHPHTLTSMNNLAGAYQEAGKLDLALTLFEDTLKLRKAKLGPDDPHTLTSMNNLAAAYWSAKQLNKSSSPLFEETLKRKKAKFGPDHADTLRTAANLGVNYKDAGRLKEAIPLLEEAHRAAQKYHTLRGFTRSLLEAYAKAGENAKIAHLLLEQLPETRKALPKESPQLAGLLAQIGLDLLEQKKMGRGRTPPSRVPGYPRENAARRLDNLRRAIAARRGAIGPEEVRRRRTAVAHRLRGHEGPREDHPPAGARPPHRSDRPAHRTVHRDEPAGRGEEVARRAQAVPAAPGEAMTTVSYRNWKYARAWLREALEK